MRNNADYKAYMIYLNYAPEIQSMIYTTNWIERGSVSKSVSGRNSKKGPAKILTGPNKFVILGDKT